MAIVASPATKASLALKQLLPDLSNHAIAIFHLLDSQPYFSHPLVCCVRWSRRTRLRV